MKASDRWRREDGRGLTELAAGPVRARAFVAYLGQRPLKDGRGEILRLATLLRRLYAGEILGD